MLDSFLRYCLKRTKFLIWGEEPSSGHSGHALSLIMIPIEGAASSRVEEEIFLHLEEAPFDKTESVQVR